MSDFIWSLDTAFDYDAASAPIDNAVRILKRDMGLYLTGRGGANTVRVAKGDELADEAYRVSVSPDEISVSYGGELGAVYGLLSLSARYLGVAPMGFWNDQTILPRLWAAAPCESYHSPAYAVRYRGWMINDEVLLDGWKDTHAQERDMWARIFETVLRCGGNMVMPGTDRGSDELALLALDMGLWVTQHHAELLGARMFGRVYPDLTPSYQQHPDLFEGLWQEAIDKFKGRKMVWAIGFRGQGDSAFWHADKAFDTDAARGGLISRVMRRQMELVRACDPKAVFCTNLYGEMMGLYRKGCLDVPEGVIKIWGDNGYGKMVSRRQNNDNPRTDAMPGASEAAPNGIYYHASFYDLQAANHITMSQNPPAMIAGELAAVLERGADAYWLINVGSVKPHIYILDLISRIWLAGRADVAKHALTYARTYFHHDGVAELFTDFASHTVAYGPNPDDKAGDQYFHFPLRYLARRLLRGETEAGAPELYWAAGEGDFLSQVRAIKDRCAAGVTSWPDYIAHCRRVMGELDAAGARLLSDTLILQAEIHNTGCHGLLDFCRACECELTGKHVEAYLYTDRALRANRRGVAALEAAEHGEFKNIYRNECFTNLRLTVRVLEAVRGWLRVRYDGPCLYDWEKRYLTPREETLVVCLTHRKNQMDDDTLCAALAKIVPLAE